MGSVRGELIVIASALPGGPALAEVCDKVRPDWVPQDGPVTLPGEIWLQLSFWPWMIIVAFTVTALGMRSKALLLVASVLCLVALGFYWWTEDPYIATLAINEGCAGPRGSLLVLPGFLLFLTLLSRKWAY
jgi:hypothetical protein